MCVHLSLLSLKQTLTACWTAWPCRHFIFHLASSINHSTPIQCDAHGHPPSLAFIIPLRWKMYSSGKLRWRKSKEHHSYAAACAVYTVYERYRETKKEERKEESSDTKGRFGLLWIGYIRVVRKTDKRLGLLHVPSRLCFYLNIHWADTGFSRHRL